MVGMPKLYTMNPIAVSIILCFMPVVNNGGINVRISTAFPIPVTTTTSTTKQLRRQQQHQLPNHVVLRRNNNSISNKITVPFTSSTSSNEMVVGQSLSSTSSDGVDLLSDFTIDDFKSLDTDDDEDIMDENHSSSKNNNNNDSSDVHVTHHSKNDHVETDIDSVVFLNMIETTPRGQLKDDELESIRDILLATRDSVVVIDDDEERHGINTALTMERLLLRWVDEYKVRPSCTIQPCTDDFVLVMQLWEQRLPTGSINHQQRKTITEPLSTTAIEHIRTLLSVVKECHQYQTTSNNNISLSLRPNLDMYRIVLRALSHSTERQIDRKGEKLFLEMQTEYQIEPDVSCYESVIYMLAKSRNDGAAHRAERLLRDAIATIQKQQQLLPPATSDTNNNHYVQQMIGVDTFNVVITAWAKSGIEYGPERAEQLIHLMSEVDMEPNIHTFTSLIDAYAQGNTWDTASQCERIFNRVLDLYLNTINTNDADKSSHNSSFEPSVVSWSVVVSAWGRLAKNGHRGASDRADKLLRRMETLHQEQRISHGPDPLLYVKCMNANACSRTVEGLHRASQILSEMYERYLDGDDIYSPTARSVQGLIDNWTRSQLPNKMDEAEALFNMYKDHIFDNVPDSIDKQVLLNAIYKSMIIGWAQDGDPILAQECLEEMMETGRFTPESICFEKIIDSNTQLIEDDKYATKRSYAVFHLLEECRMQRSDFAPSERAYTAFIRAMTKGRVPNLAQKAYAIIQKMEDLYRQGNNESIMPTVYTYNSVLLACAESASLTSDTVQQRETLRIAVTIFNNLRLGTGTCHLDSVSCGNMLRCSNLLSCAEDSSSAQKDEFISSIFQLCCERGFVNYFILRDLFMVASDDLREKLIGTNMTLNDEIMEELPSSWQRNANKKSTKTSENVIARNDSFPRRNQGSKPFRSKRR